MTPDEECPQQGCAGDPGWGCGGKGKATAELHECPFDEVAPKDPCRCCDECAGHCADEI